MDVRIYDGEEIRITAIDKSGHEHHLFVNFRQVVNAGTKLVDGLSQAEIESLEGNKKIMAIKLYRERNGCSLKDAKDAIDQWIAKYRCCSKYPYCEHEKSLEGLSVDHLYSKVVGDLSMTWGYPEEISMDQAMALQKKAGFSPDDYGFYSFRVESGHTKWAANRYPPGEWS